MTPIGPQRRVSNATSILAALEDSPPLQQPHRTAPSVAAPTSIDRNGSFHSDDIGDDSFFQDINLEGLDQMTVLAQAESSPVARLAASTGATVARRGRLAELIGNGSVEDSNSPPPEYRSFDAGRGDVAWTSRLTADLVPLSTANADAPRVSDKLRLMAARECYLINPIAQCGTATLSRRLSLLLTTTRCAYSHWIEWSARRCGPWSSRDSHG